MNLKNHKQMIGCGIAAALFCGLGSWSVAQQTAPRAGALPGSSSDTSQVTEPAAPSGSLPAGHPDISQMVKPTNSPGAAGSAMPVGVNLPAGHPDIPGMAAKPASTQPLAVSGTVLIQAKQSSADAPPAGADDYTLEFYIQGRLLDRVEGKLDAQGKASFNGVPLGLHPQPIVRITHAGAVYEASGQQMDGTTPQQTLEVPVYETTDKAPDWHVRMRHVMVDRAPGGLQVMEMIAVDNPGDRAWAGTPGADGKKVTFTLDLPATAEQIRPVAGLREPFVQIKDHQITNLAPIVPGTTQYQILYFIPAVDGKAELTVHSPVAVQNLLMFLPDDGTAVKAEGITLAGSSDMGSGKMRFYKASDVPTDHSVRLAISGIVDVEQTPSVAMNNNSSNVAKILAGGGAAIILLFGIAFLFIKGAPKKA